MTRTQLLTLLQDTILTLKEKNKELLTNKPLSTAWQNQNKRVTEEIKKLNPADLKWLEENYSTWFKSIQS